MRYGQVAVFLFLIVSVASAETRVHGSFRSRAEAWDWFEGQANNSYLFSGNLFRLSLSGSGARTDWNVEFAAPVLLALPNDAIAPAPQGQLGLGATYFAANDGSRNSTNVFPKQAFVRFKDLLGSQGRSLRAGRFEFVDGGEVMPANPTLAYVKRERIAQRLLGHFGWTHVGRSFDGLHFVQDGPTRNFTFVGAAPTRGVFQTNGWANLPIGVFYGSLTGQVNGGRNQGEWRVLAMYYQDWRNIAKVDNRPAPIRAADREPVKIGTFGGHYLHAAETSAGTFDLMLWGMMQTGKWGTLDHLAGGIGAEAGIQPRILPSIRPWLRGGYFYGSGDGNPNDNRHTTFFQVLPTPRPFARFPMYNLMNIEDAFGMLILRPHRTLAVRFEAHSLRLANRNDLWYLGGGAFQMQTFGYVGRPSFGRKGLGGLYDVSADWNVHPSLTLSGYLGHVNGGGVLQAIYPRGNNGYFGYVEAIYRF
ncbi:MAG: alginate export family protein [Bryobacteraceae bacterium]